MADHKSDAGSEVTHISASVDSNAEYDHSRNAEEYAPSDVLCKYEAIMIRTYGIITYNSSFIVRSPGFINK